MSDTLATAGDAQRLPPTDYEMRNQAIYHAGGDVEKAKALYDFLRGGGIDAPAQPAPGAFTAQETVKEDKPKATKTEKPKATKPADPPAEPLPDVHVNTDETPALLDYAKDVQPKVLAAAARLTAAGFNPLQVLKPKLKDKYGVEHAKDVPADKWPEMLVFVDQEATKAIKAGSPTGAA